jgi:AraC-like DNA-binding protein
MGFTYPVPFLYGPIFYLYTKLLTKKIEKVGLINLLHFIPFAVGYFSLLPFYLMSVAERLKFVEMMIRGNDPLIYSIYEAFIPVQGIIYTVLTVRLVVDYNKSIKDRFSNIEKINLEWLKYLVYGMIICWFFASLSKAVDLIYYNENNLEIALHLAISILIYSIGYMGLKQPEIFVKQAELDQRDEAFEKYKKSGLDDTAAKEIKNKLLELMEKDKPYLDSELTLNKLSEMLNVSIHNLSEVINSRLNKSYYDFINEYRVEEFKKKLADPSSLNYNLISIAFDSGFNSKTSFNTIFKKMTGQTPSKYRESVQTK